MTDSFPTRPSSDLTIEVRAGNILYLCRNGWIGTQARDGPACLGSSDVGASRVGGGGAASGGRNRLIKSKRRGRRRSRCGTILCLRHGGARHGSEQGCKDRKSTRLNSSQ